MVEGVKCQPSSGSGVVEVAKRWWQYWRLLCNSGGCGGYQAVVEGVTGSGRGVGCCGGGSSFGFINIS